MGMTNQILTGLMIALVAIVPAASAEHGDRGNSCDWYNNGIIIQGTGDIDGNECSYTEDNDQDNDVTYFQYCDQRTGAAAGVVATNVAPGGEQGESEAGAGASTKCNQSTA